MGRRGMMRRAMMRDRRMSERRRLGAIVEIIQFAPLDFGTKNALNPPDHAFIFLCNQRERVAGFRGAAGAADPVRVVVHGIRHVEVDDV